MLSLNRTYLLGHLQDLGRAAPEAVAPDGVKRLFGELRPNRKRGLFPSAKGWAEKFRDPNAGRGVGNRTQACDLCPPGSSRLCNTNLRF
jgi:hypothetical protein